MAEVYEVNAKDRFRAIWKFTKFTSCFALVAGCGDVSGQREPPPPPPTIAAGTYVGDELLYGGGDPVSWTVTLPEGGRSVRASFRRCFRQECNDINDIPVVIGLNGLGVSLPEGNGLLVDYAVAPTREGTSLTWDSATGLREIRLSGPTAASAVAESSPRP